jgi:hypothetical protein
LAQADSEGAGVEDGAGVAVRPSPHHGRGPANGAKLYQCWHDALQVPNMYTHTHLHIYTHTHAHTYNYTHILS